MNTRRFISLGLLGTVVGLACLRVIYYQSKRLEIASVVDHPSSGQAKIGGDFDLTDQSNRPFSTISHRGKYMLIYFGYMYCPDICPLGLQNMSAALEHLGRDLSEIVPIFVTIDPERDKVPDLALYASNYHPSFHMLTGTPSQIQAVLKDYKVYAVKAQPDGTMSDYLMDHSTLIYLMDRNGTFIQSFPHTVDPQELTAALQKRLAQDARKPTS